MTAKEEVATAIKGHAHHIALKDGSHCKNLAIEHRTEPLGEVVFHAKHRAHTAK